MQRYLKTASNILFFERQALEAPTPVPELTNHKVVVDRSGSMYLDIQGMKDALKQVFAVEAVTNKDVTTDLYSFSSHGDVTQHWAGVPVSEIPELSGPYMREINKIQATSCTGISQALFLALKNVDKTKTTGITLFTDGYANDPSSYAEGLALDAFVDKVQAEYPLVFVNTIGFRDWCDWPRMNKIANTLSGKCTKATSFKAVLEAMHDIQGILSGRMRPALKFSASEGQMVLTINRTTGQVNAGELGKDLVLRGVSADSDLTVFKITVAPPDATLPKGVKALQDGEEYLAGALSQAFLGLGSIRKAKEVLFASGNKTLWEEHQAAMTPSSLAVMMTDLQMWTQEGGNGKFEMGRNVNPKHNLFDLADAINALPAKSVGLDVEAFMKGYRRRSIRKVMGSRNDDGTITPPRARTVAREGARVYVKSLSFNSADASVQVETEKAVWVERLSDGKVLQEVECVSLDGLRDVRTFTLISSGERNVEILPLEVYTKAAFEALSEFILPSQAKTFTPGQKVKISLKRFRMESSSETPLEPVTLMDAVVKRFVALSKSKILSAMQDKDAASPYTPEQLAALKELHLSAKLNFSPPTTVHYTDREAAIRTGAIDAFTRYKINFGTLDIRSSSDFRSGNELLQRKFSAKTAAGEKVAKPNLAGYLQGDKFEPKPTRSKETPADDLMLKYLNQYLTPPRLTNEQITAELAAANASLREANAVFQGLVMEIGSTGLLPLDLEKEMTRYTPEGLLQKYPNVELSKDEKEGIFFVGKNGLTISITPETAWYSVQAPGETEELDA